MDIGLYLVVIMLALSPIVEVRGAIPVGIAEGLDPLLVFTLAFIAASIPAPILIYGLSYIEKKFLPKIFTEIPLLERIYQASIEKARRKAEKIRKSKYVYLALACFVAIPSPGTGVWTGSLVAYVLGLSKTKSTIAVIIGNLIASIIVLIASLGVKIILSS